MLTVLITGVGSNIGQGIMKALRASGHEARIIGTDIHEMSAGLYRCDRGYLVPRVTEFGCLEKFIKICKDESVDLVFTGSDPEASFFAHHKDELKAGSGASVLISPPELVDAFQDKLKSARYFGKRELPYPATVLPEGAKGMDFPLVVKPKRGAGSRGLFFVNNAEELAHALKGSDEPIVQELLKGDEYTSGLFFDRASVLKGIITMKRELSFGTTYRAVVDDYPEVKRQLLDVASALSDSGAVGPMNVQSIMDSGGLYTIEVNPRFSGTTAFRAHLNFNEVDMAIRNFHLGQELSEANPSKGVVMRYWEEMYAPLESLDSMRSEGSVKGPAADIYRDI